MASQRIFPGKERLPPPLVFEIPIDRGSQRHIPRMLWGPAEGFAQQPGIQADIDREIQEIGRTNGSVRLLGRLRIGAGYRF